eukprot:scaffold47472_cov31-Prasinocladus_malaysianus.AAC.1
MAGSHVLILLLSLTESLKPPWVISTYKQKRARPDMTWGVDVVNSWDPVIRLCGLVVAPKADRLDTILDFCV